MRWAKRSRSGWSIYEGRRLSRTAAAKRSVKPICRSIPRSKSAPKSDDRAPPSKSARRVYPAMGGKQSCSGVEYAIHKPLGVFTEEVLLTRYSIKDLQEVCVFF